MAAEFTFDDLMAFAHAEDGVLGVVLFGSRGRGSAVDEHSDWDVVVIAVDEMVAAEVRARFPSSHGSTVEVFVRTLASLRALGAIGSADEWMRYLYAHLTPVLDRTGGELQAILDAKELLPADVREERARAAIDAFVNSAQRSLRYGTRLDGAESIPHALTAIFALDGRIRPHNKYLEWELCHHPVRGWPADELLPLLDAVLAGDPDALRGLFRRLEAAARGQGFGDVIDGWEPDVAWLRGEAGYRD